MDDYTAKEKANTLAGAVSALVITGWLAVLLLAFFPRDKKEAANMPRFNLKRYADQIGSLKKSQGTAFVEISVSHRARILR